MLLTSVSYLTCLQHFDAVGCTSGRILWCKKNQLQQSA